MPCYSPLKGYVDSETGGIRFTKDKTVQTMEVACGQCLGCRLDRSRHWAMRMVHEASLHKDNCFITLTYRPPIECTEHQRKAKQHIPDDWNLNKVHFQKFVKRLRKAYSKVHPEKKIKYYHAGEYGNVCKHGIDLRIAKCPMCKFGRPHYHAILFNITFKDLVSYKTDGARAYHTSPTLEKIWGYGQCDVGEVNFKSAAYVARYCMKKVTGKIADDHYQQIDEHGELIKVEPEYATMSNGLGRGYYEKFKSDFWPSDESSVPGHGVVPKVPRYYAEIYKETDPELYEEVKEKRLEYRKENEDEYTSSRLYSKYKVKKAATATLKREIQ